MEIAWYAVFVCRRSRAGSDWERDERVDAGHCGASSWWWHRACRQRKGHRREADRVSVGPLYNHVTGYFGDILSYYHVSMSP